MMLFFCIKYFTWNEEFGFFFLDTLVLLLNVWLYYYNFSLSQSTENIVWGYPFLPDKYFKHMTSSCFSYYHKEQEKLIATGRLRRGFCLTITVVKFFFWNILVFFFPTFFSSLCLCPKPTELCFGSSTLSNKLILLWGGRKDFSCVQECRFLPPVKC